MTVRRDGKQRLYSADRQQLGPVEAFLESFWAAQPDRLATLAEEAEERADEALAAQLRVGEQVEHALLALDGADRARVLGPVVLALVVGRRGVVA